MIINRTPDLIQLLNEHTTEEYPRHYLGMSQLGESCERKLQYSFRWVKKEPINAKLTRIFRDGRVLELQIIQELERVGMIVGSKQVELVGYQNHELGHPDGIANNVPFQEPNKRFLLEVKTHNKKNFDLVVKHGVRKAKPLHYSQTIRYMPKVNCDFYMYIAYCKDDSAMWAEFGTFDQDHYDLLEERSERVITSDKLLPRIGSGLRTWHECKYCNYNKICHDKAEIAKNCRTCEYVSVEENGIWKCIDPELVRLEIEQELTVKQQQEGCHHYKFDEAYFS